MKKEIKKLKEIEDSYDCDLPKEFVYREQNIKQKDFIEYKQDCVKRLAILEKKVDNPGFWQNLKVIFSESDENN